MALAPCCLMAMACLANASDHNRIPAGFGTRATAHEFGKQREVVDMAEYGYQVLTLL